jgi:hypothetical protein
MGEEKIEFGQDVKYSFKISIPLPPFMLFEWGKDGKGVSHSSSLVDCSSRSALIFAWKLFQ